MVVRIVNTIGITSGVLIVGMFEFMQDSNIVSRSHYTPVLFR